MRRALSVVGGILIAGLAVFVPFSGCGGEGSYRLRVIFPDEQARGQAAQVTIWALEPGGHGCNELMSGEVRPDDLGELSRVEVQAPFEQGSKLRRVPEGEVLFVAEGETGSGARIMRGCTLAEIRAGATVLVTIELAVVCTPETEVIGNGTDDDCDGQTDECEQDTDCDDGNPCTNDSCTDSRCVNEQLDDGTTCGANAQCVAGRCKCNDNWDDCNSDQGDGCETSLETLTDCGACGTSCSRANATASCFGGSCHIESCKSHFADIDGNDENGCEACAPAYTNYPGCDQCAAGYIGYPNCTDDPCDPDPCNGHGTCSGGACTCDPGYTGATCDQCSTFGEYPDCFLPDAGYCDTSQCIIVPPTNQNQCYDNSAQMTCTAFPCNADGTPDFCGEDAQYPDNIRVFTCYDAGGTVQDPCDSTADPDEVVTDSLTGLMWQRTWASGLTWQQAMDYCDSLVYAGYDDWRLPNPFELQSIVDYGTSSPAIDTAVFPGTPSGWFWSSSYDAFNTANAWLVSFGNGAVTSCSKGEDYNAYRCVRSGPSFTDSGGGERYYSQEPVAGEQVIYDAVTGLLWQKSYASGLTWQQALSYCEGLDYAGHDDWKLPDIKELVSLVNYSTYSPASDFPDMPLDRFCSSSSCAGRTDAAWHVVFGDGRVDDYSKKSSTFNARCVRPGP